MSQLKTFLDFPPGQKRTQANAKLYACRGERCVQTDRDTRRQKCPDCVLCDENETLGDLMDRLARGDA